MIDLDSLAGLPDSARIWIYGFASPLTDHHRQLISERIGAFLGEWHSHRVGVRGGFAILHDRFVVLAGVSPDGVSGCSIDSSVDNFKYLRDAHGLDGLNRALLFFRDDRGTIRAVDRQEFRGHPMSPETAVFDTTLQTLGDLRAGRFERRLCDSWHARLVRTI